MADRRCFNKKITESDAFLEMPMSSQCLYFHLNFAADDDGFVNAPKKIMRMVGANEDDLKVLITKRFLLAFDSGVIVIKHWRIHNSLRNDRYHPTDYQEEFKQLGLKDNGSYTMATKWQPNGNQMETELNITKPNITKQNKHKYGNYSNVSLSDDEKLKLDEKFGDKDTEAIIQWFSAYIEEKDYKCKSHYLAILRWVGDAYYESLKRKPKQKEAVPVYEGFEY